jgi:hypothetical protein
MIVDFLCHSELSHTHYLSPFPAILPPHYALSILHTWTNQFEVSETETCVPILWVRRDVFGRQFELFCSRASEGDTFTPLKRLNVEIGTGPVEFKKLDNADRSVRVDVMAFDP